MRVAFRWKTKKAKDGSENLNINFIKSFEYFLKKRNTTLVQLWSSLLAEFISLGTLAYRR